MKKFNALLNWDHDITVTPMIDVASSLAEIINKWTGFANVEVRIDSEYLEVRFHSPITDYARIVLQFNLETKESQIGNLQDFGITIDDIKTILDLMD